MTDFKIGQKWISNAEPELGMGRIIQIEHRTVSLYFDAAAEQRTYASREAPLTRARFNPGDHIATSDGITITVDSVKDRDGILIYHGHYNGTATAVVETELDANVRFSKPEDRLFTHQVDDNEWFNLRYASLTRQAELSQARSRGLYGPRVAMVPHQLYIASEVASRFAPRVLLADEVGLGKTIEAGLIVHQQLVSGRATRVLVVVPPALTFQWFVEMIRRFNLQFTVLDETRCQQITADNAAVDEALDEELATELDNPFDAQQLCLCSLDLFLDNADRLDEAIESGWDLVVVDEAHHLTWTPEYESPGYSAIDALSRATGGLLLLTATPEQLGREGHFARLRLLDPDRFHDYASFLAEEDGFESVAAAVNGLLTHSDADARKKARDLLRSNLDLSLNDEPTDDELISMMLDRHGTGRVLFRNVRGSVEGFPKRLPVPVPLDCPTEYEDSASLYQETGHPGWTTFDPRVNWLIQELGNNPDAKYLVIAAHRDTALAIERHLLEHTLVRAAVFHEGMDLVARDRAATYFAETERGAQVLVCSEIGSEGRNFQFASRLVLFDLPDSPDLLEQRIGRLDRIGQQRDVTIYIPYLKGTRAESLYRWYAEGVGAFEAPNPAAQALYDRWRDRISETGLDAVIESTREENQLRRDQLNRGRDRLLELNSHDRAVSADLVEDIRSFEGGAALASYMEQSFDAFGLESEQLDETAWVVRPTESMMRNFSASIETLGHYHYPELPEDGIQFTFDRATALAREDLNFFTWEHPIVQQALELVISDVTGNTALIAVRHPQLPSGTLLVESLHVVLCVAPPSLATDRFLPPIVLRSLISPNKQDVSAHLPFTDFETERLDTNASAMHKLLDSQRDGIREMLASAQTRAEQEFDDLRKQALQAASVSFDTELSRLRYLSTVNPNVREEEIRFLESGKTQTLDAIQASGIRLDAVRVIVAA